MNGQPTSRTPSFLGQGCLILLPMLVLTAIGAYALRQDKRLVEQEARTRAQEIANTLASEIWKELPFAPPSAIDPTSPARIQFTDKNRQRFHVDAAGRLIYPPPYPTIPTPRQFDLQGLSADSAALWIAAQLSPVNPVSPDTGALAWERFLATNPPEPFASAAEYALGLECLKQQNASRAAQHFAELLQRAPGAVLESGLPLAPLAQLRLLEITARAGVSPSASLDTICSNLVSRPSTLTPRLLEIVRGLHGRDAAPSVELRQWWETWQHHEQARALHAVARAAWHKESEPDLRPDSIEDSDTTVKREANRFPDSFWIESEGLWLARRDDLGPSDEAILCLSETEVRRFLAELLRQPNRLPRYFEIALEVAGKPVLKPAAMTALWATTISPPAPNPSSDASLEMTNEGRPTSGQAAPLPPSRRPSSKPVKVSVYLANADLLYAHQRRRTFWFGSLLAAASAIALLGFAAARRAFYRQLRLNELKSNFVSSVSHELRAPIASVRLMAEGLESGRVHAPSKQREYFGLIVQECRRLSSLIENVLDFSRIEQGRKQYEMEPTDVLSLVRQTVALMKPHAGERSVHLTTTLEDSASLPADLVPVLDGRAMQQALINLIDNAIKHSHKDGAVTVGLELENAGDAVSSTAVHDAPGTPAHLRLWVEDKGDGIPAEEHERIFERFYRVGSELRRKTPGVGIGLSIVRHIAEAHGGRVTVRSAPGEGSRFTIEWPICSRPAKPNASAASSEYA